ncbi:MAG: zinc-dependent metalloprotease [Bacteroidales bacterium]|nr:zinc-dependent metalloprotease [Bacteroidales bacterium]
MRHRIFVALAVVLASTAPSQAQDKKYPDFNELVKGAKVFEGLLTLHQKDDHVYAEIKQTQFNKPFLLPIAVARGAGMGGTTLNFGDQWVILFKKVEDKVFVIRRNTRFTAKSGTPEAKAVETTYADSVLLAVPIKSVNAAKSTTVIDLNSIFFADFAELGIGSLDRERTTWHSVKAFKNNVELQVAATFSGGRAGFHGTNGVIDNRGITVVVHYGLVEMPDSSYHARHADDRVGHFLTAVKDFSKSSTDSAFVRYVNRWRLERADGATTWKPGDRLSPPKKAIVYWIEDTVPDEFRGAVRDGILEWNKAFAKIGFRDAIEVRQQQGEEFDPEDMSYATFRWITSETAYAIGPSRANPLTGEILDADILFDGSMVRHYRQEDRLYRNEKGTLVEPASAIQAARRGWEIATHPLALRGAPAGWNDPLMKTVDPEDRRWQKATAVNAGLCQCASHKSGELALAVAVLAAEAGLKEGEKVPEDLLQQAVKEVVMHEVGHTLGLRHNFKASTMLKNEQLHDTAITRKIGLVGSVMDYSPANIAPKGEKQGDYFTTTIGPYDYWAIEYAYKPLSGGTDGETGQLAKIASRVATPELIYGTDEDMYGTADPLVNVWDLGADTLKFGSDRMKLARGLLATMTQSAVDEGEGYQRVRQAFGLILRQFGDAAFLASKQVGGVYLYRDHKGDANARDPLVPVPAEKQRAALTFLRDNVLTDQALVIPPDVLRKLGADRWYHWGNERVLINGVDFPLNERILAIQSVALNELLDAGTLRRIQNNIRSTGEKEKPLTLDEVFRTLTEGIYADLPAVGGKAAARKSSVTGRNLQRVYLAHLANLTLGRVGAVPADARSLARLHLREISKRAAAAAKTEKEDTTRAHLEETVDRIQKVLDAQMTAITP